MKNDVLKVSIQAKDKGSKVLLFSLKQFKKFKQAMVCN